MNSMIGHNARRISRDTARINDLLNYIEANPSASRSQIVKALSKKWGVGAHTARIPLEYCKRHKLITAETVWKIQPAAQQNII